MERAEALELLLRLANKGSLGEAITCTTSELGDWMGLSQQTASRRVREAREAGYLAKDEIRVTSFGRALLQEYHDELGVALGRAPLRASGHIASGLGEGQYYLSRPGYMAAFKELLNMEPYPGTLNVHLADHDKSLLSLAARHAPILFPGFEAEGRTFGGIRLAHAKVNGVTCALVMPLRTHHDQTLELIAPVCLRDELSVQDGDLVDVCIDLEAA